MSDDAIMLYALRCEYLANPLGIDIKKPLLSWKLASNRHNVMQTAYQIQVSESASWDALIWDTGIIADDSVQVLYAGDTLQSRQRYFWRVRIWDELNLVSDWSETAFWEMGLLDIADWQARWIEPVQKPAQPEPEINIFQNLETVSPQEDSDTSRLNPCQYLRKAFRSQGEITKARIYATAHGVYRLMLNGVRVGNQELAPEVTAYDDYLQYQTYDVTEMIQSDDNVLGAVLADGWYCGRIGLPGDSCQYGDKLALLLQLEIEYSDGQREIIISDSDFKSSTGAVVYSDLFIGERYDANLEQKAWSTPEFTDDGWQAVSVTDYGYSNLVAQYGEALKIVEEITPVAILQTPEGDTVIDLGQNISGKLRMRVHSMTKATIILDHFEMLDADGNVLHKIMGRNKDQRDIYVSKGIGEEVYEPYFTTHGFRYVRIIGYPDEPQLEDFSGLVIASDLEETGHFTCSDERLNQLQNNIRWSQRSNLVSIPTDCPQRERAGFTGDAQVFIPTACFNMDVMAFFTRWLRNLQIEQREDGQIPVIVPNWKGYIEGMYAILQAGSHTSAGWGDACIIVPHVLYQTYGDARILEENYPTMKRWLDYVQKEAENGIPEHLEATLTPQSRENHKYLWNTGFHFGDWLMPSLSGGNPMEAAGLTKEIAATCYYAYSTELMAAIAKILAKEEDYQYYTALNKKIREAFAEEYVLDDGKLTSHYQGMYVLALNMKMIPDEKRDLLTGHLVNLITENDFRLDTGFVSVPYLMDVLCDNGRSDIAFRLLFQTKSPSWLYEVESGATTIWERWDAISPDGEVNVTSYNHYAFGCVGDWMVRYIAGLDKNQAGYKHILIEPHPTEELTQARASYQSIYGEIISAWNLEDGLMRLEVSIPANTSARVRLPHAELADIPDNYKAISDVQDVLVDIGSGSYSFKYPMRVN